MFGSGKSMSDNGFEGIAIVGMAGRFPGARAVDEFWKNLVEGVESISRFPAEELIRAGADPALVERPGYVRANAVLAGVEDFDARFFGFTPREAEVTDPQQRIFLECCWEALENSAYDPLRHAGTTGIYAGAGINTYLLSNLMPSGLATDPTRAFQTSIHNKNDHLTTRVAYKLNLRGPAITVQTACSTSLVAVSLACQSLLSYQCDMALAGGVTVNVPQVHGYLYVEGGTASPDGHCRAFDARAQGTVAGNGAGVVVLKRLEDALASGDHIYAVIKGVAINNDGAHKQGYTAPGVDSQTEVVAMAQAMAGFEPTDVTYVEAHGTGTALGDPVEMAALIQAFSNGAHNPKHYCAVGSVKTNIGHLDAAAGVAGLIKTALALQHRKIPPSLHFETPNPRIDFANSPFFVNSRLAEWKSSGAPRRAGVSSFGIGGTNAHVALEQAPEVVATPSDRPWQLLPLSAATESALEKATGNLARHLAAHPDLAIADVAHSLQVGRSVLPYRRAAICRDTSDAVRVLESLTPDRVLSRHQEKIRRPVVFLFPGQGSQSVNMAAELYRFQPLFRRELDRCSELLQPHLGLRILDVIFPPDNSGPLDQTGFTQPALFAVEYALARLWMELGLQPHAMLGHSIGEYVAACLAGVFTLEDALAVVAFRGKLMQSLPEGAMLAVPLGELESASMLAGGLSIAAVNGAERCIVAGSPAEVGRLEADLSAKGIPVQRLATNRAFHSTMTEPAMDELRGFFKNIPLSPPQIPYLSNVTGTWIAPEDATSPDYWARHLRQTVRFAEGLDEVLKIPDAVLIEAGPGKTLKTLARWHPAKSASHVVIASLPSRDEQASDYPHFLRAVGEAWVAGMEINWSRLHEGERRLRVPLPTYPFERQRYWIEATAAAKSTAPGEQTNLFYVPAWKRMEPVRGDSKALTGQRWLVLAGPNSFGGRIAGALLSRGADVSIVAPGGELHDSLADRSYIVHAGELGFRSLIELAQALGKRAATPISITVVSSGMQSVLATDTVFPEKATLLGAVKVIPLEYDQIRCRSIDVALPEAGSADEATLIASIINETLASGTGAISAWRGGERFVQQFERTRLAAADHVWKQQGVYLITGGFGGVGFAIAEHLARTCRARLILLSRSGAPDGHAGIRRLEALGAEVFAAAADVTDRAAMAQALNQAHEKFGRIDGVIHAAGIAGGGMIQLRSAGAMARVLAPKVDGTRVLAELIAADKPEFFVLMSSLAGVVGRPGQVDYCAANAFLDAFAREHMSKTGIRTVSIDWGEWRGVGMASRGPLASPGEDHPLLGARSMESNGAEVYRKRFRVDTHWVLDEHRLVGTAVIPGTAYIEMVRAALADRARGRCIEIRDLFFLAPLRVRNDQTREIRLVMTPNGDGFDFYVESDLAAGGRAVSGLARYASGHACVVDADPPPPIDLMEVTARCSRREVPREEDREEDLGPRWQNVVASQVGGDEVLVQLELAEAFSADFETIQYHPALMDRATGRAQEHLAEGAFLPISYRRLRMHRPVPRSIYSYARYRRNIDPSGETLTFDTVVADSAGTPLVEIEGFTQRRIGDAAAAIKAFSSEQPAQAEIMPDDAKPAGMSVEEGIEALERILAAQPGPQVAVSTFDLIAELEQPGSAARKQALDAVVSAATRPPSLHPRPDLDIEYVECRTDAEHRVAGAWRETLGLERVGIHDNFFALGGDSVQAIQIIASLARVGVRLTPQQFFQYQTIAELAASLPGDVPEERGAMPHGTAPLIELEEQELQDLSALIEEEDAAAAQPSRAPTNSAGAPLRFSLFYFADEDAAARDEKYRLYLEGARFADQNGFEAVWTPERHFNRKGGLYPNPSVLSAALAVSTQRIQLRSGSVVIPLHSSLRVAEEWAVVDNLSGGRIGLSFTSGWQPNDFAFFPERYRDKRALMFTAIEEVRRLWRGESIPGCDGAGEPIEVRVFPRPIQAELPIWITCSGDPEMFRRAGEMGANVLTALLTQTVDEAAAKIAIYREARAKNGFDPAAGQVTMMIHAFVGDDADRVLSVVRQPLCNYLKSHVALIETGARGLGIDVNRDNLERHLDDLAAFAFERYYHTASLIGTPQHCMRMVERLIEIGVNEAACLIDFGVATEAVLSGLKHLAELQELARHRPAEVMQSARSTG
jgi:natural product biosynthesis luciferase-like monooxygenase protein